VFDKGLGDAISKKLTTEDKLHTSLERSFALLMHAGYFDPLQSVPFSKIAPDDVGTAESHALAKDAALQGMVLLQNKNNAIPLKRGASIKTAVLGPLANIVSDL
jgi:beta-glucosidase